MLRKAGAKAGPALTSRYRTETGKRAGGMPKGRGESLSLLTQQGLQTRPSCEMRLGNTPGTSRMIRLGRRDEKEQKWGRPATTMGAPETKSRPRPESKKKG
eukprot:3984663-Alexandrium_andersonii.AAC.1